MRINLMLFPCQLSQLSRALYQFNHLGFMRSDSIRELHGLCAYEKYVQVIYNFKLNRRSYYR